MSINDLSDEIEGIALRALFQSKAISTCPIHGDVLITSGDTEAERLAYAIATNELKEIDEMFLREDVMEAVKQQINMADDQCNICKSIFEND